MKTFSALLFLSLSLSTYAQRDSISTAKNAEEVVVTATRTVKKEKDIAVPMALIDGKQIQLSGLTRLNEILAEQTGLTLVNDHGTGIQIQGFDPAYTMVLIDGEPLLGRTAGTLELSRISLRNVKRIEILKGGGSCLYGSEAMGGVLNIITYPPSEQLNAGGFIRYGSNSTTDVGADASGKTGKISWYGFINRYSTKGFDLLPDRPGTSVSPYENYTGNIRLFFPLGRSWEGKLSGRYFIETQKPSQLYTAGAVFTQSSQLSDGNYTFSAEKQLSNGWLVKNKFYSSLYTAKTELLIGELDEGTNFRQSFNRLEATAERNLNTKHAVNSGIGLVHEQLRSDRYSGDPSFNSLYFFIQDDYKPANKLNLVGGIRFDHHGAFGDQISPKLSALYKLKPWLRLKSSFGSGFKAPDFRQLYLDFSNPVVGYSVFGSRNAVNRIGDLEQQGLITRRLSALNQIHELTAEVSRSVNVGFSIDLGKKTELSANAFLNSIHNLIETLPVAEKTNGQFIYSYINLNRVITRGLEFNLKSNPIKNLQVSGGYQYLEAYDPGVVKAVEAGEYFLKDPNSTRTVTMKRSHYKGLFNRSPHSGNVKLSYSFKKAGIETSLRWIYRSSYGFADANGNLILDITDEFVKGYSLVNASISKSIKTFTIQFTTENIFNYKQALYLPSTPGRLYNLAIFWKLNQS